MNKPIKVYLLSGFLGSGKTTVLKRMIEEFKNRNMKLGIILNELGDTNVEQHLFKDERAYELLNGCICCSIQDDLKTTLNQFVQSPVDVLLIEGTGVANPQEIIDALSSPDYIDYFPLTSLISLVDASHFLDYHSIFSSSKEIRQLLKEQISHASLLIVNKTDLVSSKKLEKVMTKINEMASDQAKVILSEYGEVSFDELLAARIKTIDLLSSNSSNRLPHHTIKAIKIEDIPSIDRKTFVSWLKELPKDVIRGKGFVRFHDDPFLYSFQFASKKVYFEKVDVSATETPIIILIGNHLDPSTIRSSFDYAFYV
ncbi:CobW family GTP-binding protein [Metabacillus halosaccharovorans]|uniref:CobW family GTP-binding protein n=1 Tax=Metabacillus halosaccharovorans TaxID=930124 RepID=UPI001C2003EA|nr:GTP-binding protein [Metabacillus halosaccharovorans]MBU7594351.1 GTP-binding protein [Metabacillus halosaccharovorans]